MSAFNPSDVRQTVRALIASLAASPSVAAQSRFLSPGATRLAIIAGVALVTALPTTGEAIPYTFTPIAQQRFGVVGAEEFRSLQLGRSEPAINDQGVVAFIAKRGNSTDGIWSGVYAGDGNSATLSAPQLTVFEASGLNINALGSVDINNSGQVAYRYSSGFKNAAVFLDSITPGTPGIDLAAGVWATAGPSLNNGGTVAYQGRTVSNVQTIFTNRAGAGAPQAAFRAGAGTPWLGFGSTAPDINDAGVISFKGWASGTGGFGVFTGGGAQPLTTIFEEDGRNPGSIFDDVGDAPAINNSSTVITKGRLVGGYSFFVATGDGSSVDTIATGASRLSDPGTACPNCPIPPTFDTPSFETCCDTGADRYQPSINDFGQVAFFGYPRAGGTNDWGIFTGPDTVADKVVQVGDRIDIVGVGTVSATGSPMFNRNGLNNRGQVAFVQPTDIGLFVLRADPVAGFLPNNAMAVGGSGPFTVEVELDPEGLGIADTAFIDAPVVSGLTGYRFSVSPGADLGNPHLFTSVTLPLGFLQDTMVELAVDGVVVELGVGDLFPFAGGGVDSFTLTGIDIAGGDPALFPVGVTFNHASIANLMLTPQTSGNDSGGVVPAPEPATLALLALGLVGVGARRRRIH